MNRPFLILLSVVVAVAAAGAAAATVIPGDTFDLKSFYNIWNVNFTNGSHLNFTNGTVQRLNATQNITASWILANISCTQISNGSDGDFCTDASGGGGAGAPELVSNPNDFAYFNDSTITAHSLSLNATNGTLNASMVNTSKLNGAYFIDRNEPNITNKINACGKNCTFYIQDGNYSVTSTIILNNGVRLIGYGMGSTIFNCLYNITCIKAPNNTRVYRVSVQDIYLTGGNATNGSTGIDFTNISLSEFRNLQIRDFDKGIYGSGLNYYNDFYHLEVVGNINNIWLNGSSNENHFYGATVRDGTNQTLHINGSNQINFHGVAFEGANQVTNISEGARNILFSGNRFEMTGTSTFTTDATTEGVTIVGGLSTGMTITDNGEGNIFLITDETYRLNTNENSITTLSIKDTGSGQSENTPGIDINKSYALSGGPSGIRVYVARKGGNLLDLNMQEWDIFTISANGTILLNASRNNGPTVNFTGIGNSNNSDAFPFVYIEDLHSTSGTPTLLKIRANRNGGRFISFNNSNTELFLVNTTQGSLWTAGVLNGSVDTGGYTNTTLVRAINVNATLVNATNATFNNASIQGSIYDFFDGTCSSGFGGVGTYANGTAICHPINDTACNNDEALLGNGTCYPVVNTAWITPAQIIDVDKEDIETDLNTFVDIAGDEMTGTLSIYGGGNFTVGNLTNFSGTSGQANFSGLSNFTGNISFRNMTAVPGALIGGFFNSNCNGVAQFQIGTYVNGTSICGTVSVDSPTLDGLDSTFFWPINLTQSRSAHFLKNVTIQENLTNFGNTSLGNGALNISTAANGNISISKNVTMTNSACQVFNSTTGIIRSICINATGTIIER